MWKFEKDIIINVIEQAVKSQKLNLFKLDTFY